MTRRDTCRYPACDREPDADATGYSGRFCSTEHELKYDHVKADAEDARRADLERSRGGRPRFGRGY